MEMFKPTFYWYFWHLLWYHWRWTLPRIRKGRVNDYLFEKMRNHEPDGRRNKL